MDLQNSNNADPKTLGLTPDDTEYRNLINLMNMLVPGIDEKGHLFFWGGRGNEWYTINGSTIQNPDGSRGLGPPWSIDKPITLVALLIKFGFPTVYHFTPSENVESIKKIGLKPLQKLTQNQITPKYISSEFSRTKEKERGLDQYVKFSFVPYHPMIINQRNIQITIFEIPVTEICDHTSLVCSVNSIRTDSQLYKVDDLSNFCFENFDTNLISEVRKQQADRFRFRPNPNSSQWHSCQAELMSSKDIPYEALSIFDTINA